MTTAADQQLDPNAWLLGGGVPSAKFEAVGATVTGTISEPPSVQQQRDYSSGQPKFWDDGSPMMQLVITLATDTRDPDIDGDTGHRRIYVKGQLKNAVADAIRKAGAKGLEVGGTLTVTYIGDGEASKKGFNPPKQYAVAYTAPSAAQAAAFLGTTEPDQQPAAAAGNRIDPALAAAVTNLTDAQKAQLPPEIRAQLGIA